MDARIQTSTNNPANWLAGLTAVYACLKLLGVIDWSWWRVFSPTLIPLGLGLSLLVMLAVMNLLVHFARWVTSL